MPDMHLQPDYKEAAPLKPIADGNWQIGVPAESADRGEWWKIFDDAELNALELEAAQANQSLKAAEARLEQARALVRVSRAGFFPSIDAGANVSRIKPGSAQFSSFGADNIQAKPYTDYSAEATISYEADLFGSVRENYHAADFAADSQEATYRSMLLALQADVAQNYFALRALDAEKQLLRDTVDIRTEAARIMGRRFAEGDVGQADDARAQTELASAKADLIALEKRRADTEHALAILLGKMPVEFALKEMPLDAMPPQIPAGLPSSLLERRPDIVAAQNMMAAANARIGIARAAFFPKLILTASGGYDSSELGDLFNWSSRTWALGPVAGTALSMPIFEGGRNFANLDLAKSGFTESVANYRQQVLVAFREVEDNLSDQRLLADQLTQQQKAADAAKQAAVVTKKRYDEGDVTYFEVVDAERTSLVQQQTAVELRGNRFATTISLIRALGGGFGDSASETKPAANAAAKETAIAAAPLQPAPAVTVQDLPAHNNVSATPLPSALPPRNAPLVAQEISAPVVTTSPSAPLAEPQDIKPSNRALPWVTLH